jgi:putative transposase
VTLAQARRVIETWRIEYNTERPHSSLGDLPPTVFAQGRSDRLSTPFLFKRVRQSF